MGEKIGTKDVKAGGGTPKTLQAGNVMATITEVSLDQPPYMVKEDGYFLLLHLEGPDLTEQGFEGFMIDKDKPKLGKYKGQVGRVKTNRWPYKDGKTKSGIAVSRDGDILKALKSLCMAMDIVKWFDDQDEKHDTIQELVAAFNADAPWKDKVMNYCICAREYMKKNTYTGLDLFLPKYSKGNVPYEELTASPSKLIQFDPENEDHLERLSPAEDNGFEPDTEGAEGTDVTESDGAVEGEASTEFTL